MSTLLDNILATLSWIQEQSDSAMQLSAKSDGHGEDLAILHSIASDIQINASMMITAIYDAQAMSTSMAKTAKPVEGEACQRGPKDAPNPHPHSE